MTPTHSDSTHVPLGRRKLLGLLAGGSIAGAAVLTLPLSVHAAAAVSGFGNAGLFTAVRAWQLGSVAWLIKPSVCGRGADRDGI